MSKSPTVLASAALALIFTSVSIYTAWWLQNENAIGNKVDSWPVAQGAIVPGKDKKQRLSYRYFAAGRSYEGHRRQAGWNEKADAAYLVTHPIGTQISVHYMPEDPSVSAIETGMDMTTALFYAGVCWLLTILFAGGSLRMWNEGPVRLR